MGGKVEVRSTHHAGGCLIVHETDRDLPFVLAIVRGATVTLAGWLPGNEGKSRDFWADKGNGRPAFFVPQTFLRDMDTLKVFLREGVAA